MSVDEALATRRAGRRLRGWKEIAAFLEISEDTAQARADVRRAQDPLPVRYDYRGPYAWESALIDWVERHDESHGAHMARVDARRRAPRPRLTSASGARSR